MNVYLVRHAQTEANYNQFIQGQTNTNITELGYKQTRITASFFRDIKISQLYCSPLGRTVETAKIISLEAQYPFNRIITSPALMEIDLSPWVGKAISELEKDESVTGYATYKKHPDLFYPSAGESFENVKKRMTEFFNNTISKFSQNSTIVIVSHSVAIRSLLLYIDNESVGNIWKYDVRPASITLIESDKKKHNVKYIGYCPYLAQK